MTLYELIQRMIQDGAFQTVVNNPLAQFGPAESPFLGATILPERPKPENEYTEEGVRYRSVVANDGTRYSPVQLKSGMMTGSFRVSLGESDIGSQITGSDYDALLRLLERAGGGSVTMAGMPQLLRWADLTLNMPLLMKNEKMRWECIVDASVVRKGDNNYTETVAYSAPSGHRPNAGGTWSSNAYDPYADIIAGAEFLAGKGYTVNRIIAGSSVVSKLTNNDKIKTRVGRLSTIGGTTVGLPGRASLQEINALLNEDGLPPIEKYDKQYRTQTGTGYYLKRDVFVMLATTGRDETIDYGDSQQLPIPNTLGYTAIGRPAGQSGSGRVSFVRVIENEKPPRVEGEAWQTSLPVVLEPEGIYVIKSIS